MTNDKPAVKLLKDAILRADLPALAAQSITEQGILPTHDHRCGCWGSSSTLHMCRYHEGFVDGLDTIARHEGNT